MGLLGKISSLREKEKKGLLHKSLDTRNEISSEHILEEKAEKVLTKISRLSQGIDAPCYLFSLIKKYIGFEKGALLLVHNSTNAWLPLASAGWHWDKEVSFKSAAAIMPELDTQSSHIFKGDKLQKARSFFPDTEFKSITSLIVKAFHHEEKLIALLIFAGNQKEQQKKVKKVITSETHRIIRAQYDLLESLNNIVLGTPDSIKDNNNIIKISFGALIRSLKEENNCMCPLWLNHILSFALARLCQRLGKVYTGENDYVFLVLNENAEIDRELAAHQAGLSLKQYFSEVRIPFKISFES